MPARHDLTRRSATVRHPPDSNAADWNVESTSTRITLDGSTRRCEACNGCIDPESRYRCLTVRDGDGTVLEIPVCDEDCLAALLS
jgi:hypothetical protein